MLYKKSFILFVLFFTITLNKIFSLDVDVDEIKNAYKIKFINYEGKHTKISTYWQIRKIGYYLAKQRSKDNIFKYYMKYSIIHAIDDTKSDKFDAEIFSIDKDANVDHIRNVRLILAGYLQKKYNYSKKDSDILAIFITYYNAAHNKDLDYYAERYKPIVLKYLSKDNAGMSARYDEWPGKTRIVIPLTYNLIKGKIDSLDTSEISDEKVIENLQDKKDKGVKERKEIVKLKEKELEKKKKEIEKEKQKIKKEKQDLDKKEKNKDSLTQNEKDQIEKKKEEIKNKEENLKKEQEKTNEKEKDIIKEKESINKDEQDIKKENTLDKKENELTKKEEKLKQKEENLQNLEDKLKSKEIDSNVYGNKIYYLKIKDYMKNGRYQNDMYILDGKNKKILVKSPLDKIGGRKFDIFNKGVVVISYKSTTNPAHYLTLLDLKKLEPKIIGKDQIFWRSFIIIKNSIIYAIIQKGSKYYLGKFDENLKLIAKSKEQISSDTFISFFSEDIFINSSDKKILILNGNNLSLKGKIIP